MSDHKYAATTKVPINKSKMDIEKLCVKYGATSYMCGWTTTNSTRRRRNSLAVAVRKQPENNFAGET